MTVRDIIIQCLDENTDVTCKKNSCDKPEREGNTGKCCHKCSLEILKEYEKQIYKKAFKALWKKVILQYDETLSLAELDEIINLIYNKL